MNGATAGLRGLAFYSTSLDGRVFHWTLGKSAMSFEVKQSPSLCMWNSGAGNAQRVLHPGHTIVMTVRLQISHVDSLILPALFEHKPCRLAAAAMQGQSCAEEACCINLQEFFSLQKPPRIAKAAKAPALEAFNVAPQPATPSYGTTCMDFHKVSMPVSAPRSHLSEHLCLSLLASESEPGPSGACKH